MIHLGQFLQNIFKGSSQAANNVSQTLAPAVGQLNGLFHAINSVNPLNPQSAGAPSSNPQGNIHDPYNQPYKIGDQPGQAGWGIHTPTQHPTVPLPHAQIPQFVIPDAPDLNHGYQNFNFRVDQPLPPSDNYDSSTGFAARGIKIPTQQTTRRPIQRGRI